jgi:hypothetical protein
MPQDVMGGFLRSSESIGCLACRTTRTLASRQWCCHSSTVAPTQGPIAARLESLGA